MRCLRLTLWLPLTALLAVPVVRQVLGSSKAAAPADAPQVERSQEKGAGSIRIALHDQPLQPFQSELLELAFEGASALPLEPHVKNRSRLQHLVVSASITLEQPQRALRCADAIVGWRRGAAYGELARCCAELRDPQAARELAARARFVAEHLEGEEVQDWQRERVLARAAEAESALLSNESSHATEISLTIEASSSTFESEWTTLESALTVVEFDQLRQALRDCAALLDRHYADAEKRGRIEARMRAAWAPMPAVVRVETATLLAESALEHGDRDHALALQDEMLDWIEQTRSAPDAYVQMLARWARLRHRTADVEGAQRAAEKAWTTFTVDRERILDIDRADTLVPLAETCHALGDPPRALSLYALALEEGLQNPNSRPRAEDLTAICLSLAGQAIEPDTHLRESLLTARAGLGDPW
jgi:hypothetical protein